MNMPLSGRRKTDGVPATITVDPAKLLRWIAYPALLTLGGYAFREYDKSKLDATRFVADSARSELRWTVRDSVLMRLDRRTKAMWCEGKGPGCE